MNLKLIIQLSLFGLIMAFATVSLIPEKIEWVFWLFIFVFVAYVIAKVGTVKYFLNVLLLIVFNSIWITAVHFLFFDSWSSHHPDMALMGSNSAYFGTHPRVMMLCMALPFGVVFGIFQGLFALIASKVVKPRVVS